MNKQWTIIFALIFTLLVAVFAVINVRSVEVDYLFGRSEWPLILVILGSVLMGALIVFSAGIFQVMKLKREIKELRKENKTAQDVIHNKEDAHLNDVQADTQDASAIIEKKD
ncbi:putative membrane protein YrvD [Bacillus mojavensis]|uniref:Membrane protein YrvD n=1 Tax=Bacillus mojavensis TaxID=72360 RepID=A0ABX6LYS0_BACMO|nr:lipopolysaccharide assembly LapA domain-containing protein [Bacillus mojavensis]QJC97038.1 putative membrane protein YrvD [Bacillus mojavensis]